MTICKAKLFSDMFGRMVAEITEIDIREVFVAVVDQIDSEAIFDFEGPDLCIVFTDGSIAHISGPPIH